MEWCQFSTVLRCPKSPTQTQALLEEGCLWGAADLLFWIVLVLLWEQSLKLLKEMVLGSFPNVLQVKLLEIAAIIILINNLKPDFELFIVFK